MIHVIIVEDDYRIANIHEEFLNKIAGVKVVGKALNGQQALQLIKEETVQLVILDIYMPDILGSKLIQEIREIDQNIDIIMISAATETEIVGDVIRTGVFDYIIKPVKMERFIETIEKYKKVKENLEASKDIDQSFLDDYFGVKKPGIVDTPKGIDPLTLQKIKENMYETEIGMTAEEMGTRIGVSRTTARRYLEYLISTGEVIAELEYGIVGRPERKYRPYKKDA
ncbi:response regulator [Virgibacillus sp. MG-45]|uniref:response regulator n=1 Tax=Virgibacillus sp. MG-45 TaxID=3102791 RepID=UPI002EDA07E2